MNRLSKFATNFVGILRLHLEVRSSVCTRAITVWGSEANVLCVSLINPTCINSGERLKCFMYHAKFEHKLYFICLMKAAVTVVLF